MSYYKLRTIALGASAAALLVIGSASAHQQDHGDNGQGRMMDNMPMMDGMMEDMPMMEDAAKGVGVIEEIDVDEGRILVDHEPIKKFGMPAMAMYFEVAEKIDLSDLDVGDEVHFMLAKTEDGGLEIRMICEKELMRTMGCMDRMGEKMPGMDAPSNAENQED